MSGKRRYKFVNMEKNMRTRRKLLIMDLFNILPRATYRGRWGHINIKREKYE
jgi:hypothetical protein